MLTDLINLKVIEGSLKNLDSQFSEIIDKALSGRELHEEEALRLLNSSFHEALILAIVADYVRERCVGDVVTFVVNRNINFTNECSIRCLFCAYSRPVGSHDAYTLPVNEVVSRAYEARKRGATEVCIQGAINPSIPVDYYFEVLRGIKSKVPEVHIHAFSPQEVHYIAAKLEISYEEALKMLRDAGLDSMPGTAAEILDDEVRKIIAPRKILTKQWIEIITKAHGLGIPTTATMMYGHVDENRHRAKHLKIIRDIQKETHGFTEFVLLPFVHYKTRLYREGLSRPGSTWIEDLKVHAVSRLFFAGYIKNIQASWVKLGPKMAQMMLNVGANDLGGTLMEENISREAGAIYGTQMEVTEFVRLIKGVGRRPAQRTTTYEIIRFFDD
ncbi:MAG: 5-amino-6-(D-ribitylamino)uracil--L-tyrosine 4-hydroxyphenyl transferase CofH [Candidatus Nezhaarchaeota archaeon]|nr:5-amino-6-(D-ribitylamino)uracil--L-tyrosine 4-hydroxyphenyl transferase CofH [Candidatus Nezhaarchaeota archaeon]MCX8141614.1 5-amino-6-(D-ribitylamino)uracil--L-tyrosine 4-hydroxyphenyl transferase CofH [Candidatus Nezhaarchaeota archaeon]MDW8049881.1 5-amino-6-(D-ribitylamino)uracil--L-tyrosine 4-hydroxyphenyl transferase CofH [Nitrososphaerota archaeon]